MERLTEAERDYKRLRNRKIQIEILAAEHHSFFHFSITKVIDKLLKRRVIGFTATLRILHHQCCCVAQQGLWGELVIRPEAEQAIKPTFLVTITTVSCAGYIPNIHVPFENIIPTTHGLLHIYFKYLFLENKAGSMKCSSLVHKWSIYRKTHFIWGVIRKRFSTLNTWENSRLTFLHNKECDNLIGTSFGEWLLKSYFMTLNNALLSVLHQYSTLMIETSSRIHFTTHATEIYNQL